MVPMVVASQSTESINDEDQKSIFQVIYKCGKLY